MLECDMFYVMYAYRWLCIHRSGYKKGKVMRKNYITSVIVILSLILVTFTGCDDMMDVSSETKTEVTESTEDADKAEETDEAKEADEADDTKDDDDTKEDEVSDDSGETDDVQDSELAGFTVYDGDLNETTIKELISDNKVTMLNFWGTFCGPCIREMPELAQIERDYKDKGFEIVGITIDAVDYDNGGIDPSIIKDAEVIMDETNVEYPVVYAGPDLIYYMEIEAVPTTVFVDENGYPLMEPIVGSNNRQGWVSIIDKLIL